MRLDGRYGLRLALVFCLLGVSGMAAVIGTGTGGGLDMGEVRAGSGSGSGAGRLRQGVSLSGSDTFSPDSRIHLYARQAVPVASLSVSASTSTFASRSSSPTSGSSSSSSSSSSSLPIAPSIIPTSPPSPVPTPMDLQLSYALSHSCLLHLTSLLSSETFTSCLPFSLLLTTSTSFGSLISSSSSTSDAQRYPTLNALLAYVSSPQPSGETCDAFLVAAAEEMGQKGKCDGDLRARVPSAQQAQNGLGNAGVMRKAAALKDPDTGAWCYLQAVASPRPDDLYLWSIPSGIRLPASTRPTCSKCSRQLLSHYAQSAPDTPTLNTTVVNSAVAVINAACGQDFAEFYATGAANTGGGSRNAPGSILVVVATFVILGVLSGV